MGLMDRDYMHEKHRQRPFSPPPERSGMSTLGMVLIFVIALFALYKVADWKLKQRAAELAAKPATVMVPTPVERPAEAPAQPFPRRPTYPNMPEQTAGIHVVTKCVVNGKTSYGDSSCTQGAVTTHVTTRTNHNIVAAVRAEAVPQTEEPANRTIVVTHNNPAADAAAKKVGCQFLNAEIERLDAMGRQPQSPQMYDWIREERKKVRDQQFRIPCQ